MFANVRVSDWDEACSIGAALFGWGFRGHASANWSIEPTLIRTARQLDCPNKWLNHREYWMLRQFQRRFPGYKHDSPVPVTKLDWLAVMQHYGSATRLLDFTYSFYVAAFFALETATGDAAIWAIDKSALNGRIAARQRCKQAADSDQANIRHIKYAETYLGLLSPKRCPRLVLPVEPEYLHGRLIAQQGFFLCPLDLQVPFQQSMEETFGLPTKVLGGGDTVEWADFHSRIDDFNVLKLIVPRRLHARAMKDLHMMNINASTLFPGLDGYARSMSIHLRVLPEQPVGAD